MNNTPYDARIEGDELEDFCFTVNNAVRALNTAHGSVSISPFDMLDGSSGDFDADYYEMGEFLQQKRAELELAEEQYAVLRHALNTGARERYEQHIEEKFSSPESDLPETR